MTVFQPLAILAAIFALITAPLWFNVAKASGAREEGSAQLRERVKLAATGTSIVLILGALSVLAVPVASLVVGLL